MNTQQMFDTVARHLLAQNCKSVDLNGIHCRYRGQGDTKCAAGVLIPDSLYTTAIETLACTVELVAAALTKAGVEVRDLNLLRQLQGIHDGYDPRDWPNQLRRLAVEHGLDASATYPTTQEVST